MASTANLVTWTRNVIGVDSAGYITDNMLVDFANVGQRKLSVAAGCIYSADSTTTVAGQELYTVPADYLKVMAVYLNHATGDKAQRALIPMSVIERDPRLTQGTPSHFYAHGANDASGNNTMVLGLQDIPDTNNAGCTLEIWIRQLPKDMVSGGQGPELAIQWQDEVVHFMASRAFTRLATMDPSKATLADREMALFQIAENRARKFQQPLALGIAQRRIIDYSPGYESD